MQSGATPVAKKEISSEEQERLNFPLVKLITEIGAREAGSAPLRIQLKRAMNLIAQGADINSRGTQGETLLLIVATRGYQAAVSDFIKRGADVNVQVLLGKDHFNEGWTPLMFAGVLRHTAIVRMLLKVGANPFLRDRWGKTALDMVLFYSPLLQKYSAVYQAIINMLQKL